MTPLRSADILRLVVLSAIWGASFMFVRVLAPVIGPMATADSRVLIGGAFVLAVALALRKRSELGRYWKAYVIMGAVNSAIPFSLFAFAALHLPASYLGILNSSTPLFAALLGTLWLDEPLTRAKVIAMVSGCFGVLLVSKAGPVVPGAMFLWAVAAALFAAFCYAASGIFLRRRAPEAPPLAVAAWSQLAAGVLLLPATSLAQPIERLRDEPSLLVHVLALGILCSGVAYLLYYRLMRDVGPTRTFTVTFLIPLFGMLWGSLFLHETITTGMVVGCAFVVGGTLGVLRPSPARVVRPAT